jgi:hypothetical protein
MKGVNGVRHLLRRAMVPLQPKSSSLGVHEKPQLIDMPPATLREKEDDGVATWGEPGAEGRCVLKGRGEDEGPLEVGFEPGRRFLLELS